MARAHDLGVQFPSDANDSFPDSPASNRTQVSYYISAKKPNLQDTADSGEAGITEIDLRTTIIRDRVTGRTGVLANICDLTENELMLKTGAKFRYPTGVAAPIDFTI